MRNAPNSTEKNPKSTLRVLITGSNGFIGKAVTDFFTKQGITWTAFDDDICSRSSFKKFSHCDTILHLAGLIRTGLTTDDIKKLMDVNIRGTINVIDFAQANGIRIIFPSSCCCYGNASTIPTPENSPTTYFSPYSFAKWQIEQTIEGWHRYLGLDSVIVRIFNVYGPGQPAGFFIPDLLEKIRFDSCRLHNLSSIRDFIHIADLARLIGRVVTRPAEGLITINAGSGRGYTVSEIVEYIFQITGRRIPILDEGFMPHIKESIADINRAKKLFDWSPKIDIFQGLKSVIQETDYRNSGLAALAQSREYN